MSFPSDFHWGAASASYQIEGAANQDGKGLSVWDMMVRKPGRIARDHTGDIACDHYHRYQHDIDLMQEIGLKAYRFSIAWPRVLPSGTGQANAAGIGFYDRLVDGLLAANIEPYVTLFHWDFPYELYLRGGWLNPDSPQWFEAYTNLVVDALSDRVTYWMTLNEPQVFVSMGHETGVHAPGDTLDTPELLRIAHHVLLAHGRSVKAIRTRAKKPPQIGAAPVGTCYVPASDRPKDIEAARRRTYAADHIWSATYFCDPMFFGHYPEDALEHFGKAMPSFTEDEMTTIQQPLDFFGCNIYHAFGFITAETDNTTSSREADDFANGYANSTIDWFATPEAMYWGTRFFYERYEKPIVITENGIASMDWVTLDGRVPDPLRIDYVTRYLMALRHAMDDGIDIRGYMQWSIMDNFEWAAGYRPRFGIIYVDYRTQMRILKDSAHWYREVIASNGRNLPTGEYRFPATVATDVYTPR